MSPPVLLVTRAEPGATTFADAARGLGWAPLVWPLLVVESVETDTPTTGVQAVLLTSANAARALPAARLSPLPPRTFCVGGATAQAADAAGYRGIEAAAGDAAALAGLVAARLSPQDGPLLFLRGETVAGDLAGLLAACRFTLREAVVYRARAAETVPAAVGDLLDRGGMAAAAFHSPRAAAIFAGLAGRWAGRLGAAEAVAISAKAAAPLAGMGFAAIRIAAEPDGEAMLAALGQVGSRRGDAPVGSGCGPGLSSLTAAASPRQERSE